MNIKYAVFDFDGTLFDSMYVWERVGEKYLLSLGIAPKPSLSDELRTMSISAAAEYLAVEYPITLTHEEISDGIIKTAEHFYLYEILPKPCAAEFLRRLVQSGFRLCIATASDEKSVIAALERCDMRGFFDRIFTCGNVGGGKESPAIYRAAAKYFNTDRDGIVIFEDALHAAKTAKRDGFFVAGVRDMSEPRREELITVCDCYIEDFAHTEPFWDFISQNTQKKRGKK